MTGGNGKKKAVQTGREKYEPVVESFADDMDFERGVNSENYDNCLKTNV